MLRLILVSVLFLLSLLTVFPAPTNLFWYVSILITEFSWVFIVLVLALLIWRFGNSGINLVTVVLGIAALIFYALPIIGAYKLSASLKHDVQTNNLFAINNTITTSPFSFSKMFTGFTAKQVQYKTFTYDSSLSLTLDFYPCSIAGKQPCVIVVHGGSWSAGDSQQLPELNSVLANAGYHVATINYRLAPQHIFPAPVDDVQSALSFLKSHSSDLKIDTSNLVLLGRSAGGQIVLSAADIIHDKNIKGVISFYGPADMVWGYANPTNPLVLNSRKVMGDYLGGTYAQVPQQYLNSSSTETANSNTVPTLLIHGKNDPLVSYLHGKRLSSKLDSVHARHYEVYMPWATHGFDWTLNGPGGQISTWIVLQFLKSVFVPQQAK